MLKGKYFFGFMLSFFTFIQALKPKTRLRKKIKISEELRNRSGSSRPVDSHVGGGTYIRKQA